MMAGKLWAGKLEMKSFTYLFLFNLCKWRRFSTAMPLYHALGMADEVPFRLTGMASLL